MIANILFVVTTLGCLFLLLRAIPMSFAHGKYWDGVSVRLLLLTIAFLLLTIQAILAANGFFRASKALPPPILFAALPSLLLLMGWWGLARSSWMRALSLERLHYLHIVRLPVEIVLLMLYQAGYLPQIITFEGQNFDVVSGLTAPFVAYFVFVRRSFPVWVAIVWNLVALSLLVNIVVTAVLSTPSPIQQFGFEQPNVAVLHYPFIWLPGFIVPVVAFAHLVCLSRLLSGRI